MTVTRQVCAYQWAQPTPPGVDHVGLLPAGSVQYCVQEQEPAGLEAEQACSRSRLIGRAPDEFDPVGELCRDFGDWVGKPLFPSHPSGELSRFCVYEPAASALACPPCEGPGCAPGLACTGYRDEPLISPAELPDWLEPDCAVVEKQSPESPLTEGSTTGETTTEADDVALTQTELQAAFLERVDAQEALPALQTGLALAPIAVAVIDTAPDPLRDGRPGSGRAPHGRAVASMISQLACPQGPNLACAAAVHNYLGLALERTEEGLLRHPRGGYFGFQGDLAHEIVDAVDDANGDQLIINLSVGWVQTWGGNDVSTLSPGALAVYRALQFARCRGALPIAAAGNAPARPTRSHGPSYPGGWQQQGIEAADCAIFGGPTSLPGESVPLVYAAGGVDERDMPLYNTPLAGRPQLAASASQALSPRSDRPAFDPSAPYTGSSIAAAVTSAAASVIWSYQRSLNADAVMDKVYASAVDLGESAEFCLSADPCPNIRRVSICEATRSACTPDSNLTPIAVSSSIQGLSESLVTLGDTPQLDGIATSNGATTIEIPQSLCQSTPSCGDGARRSELGALGDVRFSHAGVPREALRVDTWGLPPVVPKPDEPPCTVCTGGLDGLGIDLDFNTNPDNSLLWFSTNGLRVWDQDWNERYFYTANDETLEFAGGDHVTGLVTPIDTFDEMRQLEADFVVWDDLGFGIVPTELVTERLTLR